MVFVTLLMLIKTFFFLRIFQSLSFLVTMLKQVFMDLRVFILFYIILLFKFALLLAIIDLNNFEMSTNENI